MSGKPKENKWLLFAYDGTPLIVKVSKARPYSERRNYGNKVVKIEDIELVGPTISDNPWGKGEDVFKRESIAPFDQAEFDSANADLKRRAEIDEEMKRLVSTLKEEREVIDWRIRQRMYGKPAAGNPSAEELLAVLKADPTVAIYEKRNYEYGTGRRGDDDIFDPSGEMEEIPHDPDACTDSECWHEECYERVRRENSDDYDEDEEDGE